MGTWGTGLFENDWAFELLETGDAEFPASTLWGFDGAGSLDEKESAEALAAAEAIAASVRQPAVGLPDQVQMWAQRTGARADAEEVKLALRVVGVILDQNAELRDQEDETGDSLEKWLTPIDDLRRRLSAAEPASAGKAARSPSRRLRDLVAGRGPSGSRLRNGGPGADCEWRKTEFLAGKRALVVAALKERGRDQDAVKLAGYELPKAEAWLVDWEKKRITADHERGEAAVRLWREGLAEIGRRSASNPDPGQPPPAR